MPRFRNPERPPPLNLSHRPPQVADLVEAPSSLNETLVPIADDLRTLRTDLQQVQVTADGMASQVDFTLAGCVLTVSLSPSRYFSQPVEASLSIVCIAANDFTAFGWARQGVGRG